MWNFEHRCTSGVGAPPLDTRLPKAGDGRIFESCVIYLENIRPPHTQLVYSPCYLRMQWFCNAFFVMRLAYAITAIVHVCLLLLFRCFLLNITACTAAQMGGRIFDDGLIFGRLRYFLTVQRMTTICKILNWHLQWLPILNKVMY